MSSNGEDSKTWLHWDLSVVQEPGRKSLRQAEEKVETLDVTLAEVEGKVLTDTHVEKLKELELQTLKTQWPMCKAERLVDPSTNKLTEVDGNSCKG